ncbi:MAG: hypothetical protein C4296_03245 [Gemmataceae bacterium]
MSNKHSSSPSSGDRFCAWLYLQNELSDSQRQAFEERLSKDQNAREALVEVMRRLHSWPPPPSLRPDPRCREHALVRLLELRRHSVSSISWLRQTGMTIVSFLTGAACAFLVLVGVGNLSVPTRSASSSEDRPPARAPVFPQPSIVHAPSPAADNMEIIYCELTNNARLARFRAEERARRDKWEPQHAPLRVQPLSKPDAPRGRVM